MSDTQRCEPPEDLRGVDGWHSIALPHAEVKRLGIDYAVARWAATTKIWECMPHTELFYTTSIEAFAFGYRYLAPVTPPADVAALRAERDDWKRLCFIAEPEMAAMRADVAALVEALEKIRAAGCGFSAAIAHEALARVRRPDST